jgi:hypothetical protein
MLRDPYAMRPRRAQTLSSIACGSAFSPVAPSATTVTSGAAPVGPAVAVAVNAATAHDAGGTAVSEIVVNRGEFDYAGNSGAITVHRHENAAAASRAEGCGA